MCLLNNNSIFSVKCQSNLQIPTNLFLNFCKGVKFNFDRKVSSYS